MPKPVRRSQAIAPFGIGALVDFPGPVSLVHAGIDAWPFDATNPDHKEFKIDDEKRLARRLGVDFFVEPPDYRRVQTRSETSGKNLNLKLPFLRFPLWSSCPRCGRMGLSKFHQSASPVCTGPIGSGKDIGKSHKARKMVQVRFVSACKNGHMQDFPWLEWVFQDANPSWIPDGVNRWLRLRSTGSASLTGVEVRAEEIGVDGGIRLVARRTLGGAFSGTIEEGSNTSFTKIKVFCKGYNPALSRGADSHEDNVCGQQLQPLLRGASNLYFPDIVSSIYIPEIKDTSIPRDLLELFESQEIKERLQQAALGSDDGLVSEKAVKQILRSYRPECAVDVTGLTIAANRNLLPRIIFDNTKARSFLLQKLRLRSSSKLEDKDLKDVISSLFPDWEVDVAFLIPYVETLLKTDGKLISTEELDRELGHGEETSYRLEEYRVFSKPLEEGFPKTNLLIKIEGIGSYSQFIQDNFEEISLLHKLRETRAFKGFSRIFPTNDLTDIEKQQLISRDKLNWLPATVVRGEGIFLRFREEKLMEWMKNVGAKNTSRLQSMNQNIDRLRAKRNQIPETISPKYVLIHTFAHLLINELVYQCGYGSASLRERIYSSEGEESMSGVLIYTAAGDSEGSLGGLVRMGLPQTLDEVIVSALTRAGWCSADPVCIESTGQGPDNCNLAACHSCGLLPETSCEVQNRKLDRGVVIGTISEPELGYFQGF